MAKIGVITVLLLDPIKQTGLLSEVTQLWRAHSATLGFFTVGAFEEYAARRQILVAVSSDGQCAGYLLYRVSREVATIVHLCVGEAYRGRGVAKMLVEFLRGATKDLRGIGLSCRRDFSVSSLWPKLGFIATSDKVGRSHDGKLLTYWWLDHGHPTLFSNVVSADPRQRICAVIDANVFFDMGSSSDPESNESKALLADWIQENVRLCLTQEIFNEIDRQTDHNTRNREKKRAHSFEVLPDNSDRFSEIQRSLRSLFSAQLTQQDESDIRQLTRALTSDAQFFVTRDAALLDLSDRIYRDFAMSIVRPADFIVHLDRIESEADYVPARLAGSHCLFRLVRPGELEALTQTFQNSVSGESISALRRTITQLLAYPKQFECSVVYDSGGSYLALIAASQKNSSVLNLPLLRVKESTLAKTLARYLVTRELLKSSREAPLVTRITDKYLQQPTIAALVDAGYLQAKEGWSKISIPAIAGSSEIAQQLLTLTQGAEPERHILEKIASELTTKVVCADIVAAADIELALWPAIITDLPIWNYVISIRPAWAKDLFDERLAESDLFGAKLDLALRHENVYYRKNYFANLRAPGRILWYVSSDPRFPGSGCVRACSRLNEVLVDRPKELYRRFRRFGVYEWQQVYQTANRDVDKKIMAIRFSHTEAFQNPIPWPDMQAIFKSHNVRSNLESPAQIPAEVFIELIRRARGSC